MEVVTGKIESDVKNGTSDIDAGAKFNFDIYEQQQREILIELKMRRNQLEIVRKELDDEKVKSNQLKYALETSKSSNRDLENGMKILLQSKKSLEEKFKDNFDEKNKAYRQQELTIQENKMLKQLLQKAEMEKRELTRMVEDTKSQRYCDDMYKTEISNKHAQLKEEINTVLEEVKSAQIEHKVLMEQSKELEKFNDLLKNSNFYKDKVDKVKQEKCDLEHELLFTEAKLEKVQALVDDSSILPISKESEFFLKQWRNTATTLLNQLKLQQEITSNVITNLKREKQANVLLIERELTLESRINDLQKYKEFKDAEVQTVTPKQLNKSENAVVVIKSEPIEIME